MKRTSKIAGLLKVEISDIIKKRLRDPRIGFVTITDIELSPDHRHARVYVSVLGEESVRKESVDGLNRAAPFIQNILGSRVRLRYLPVLRFVLDESWEYGANIEQILETLKKNEAISSDEDSSGPEDPEEQE